MNTLIKFIKIYMKTRIQFVKARINFLQNAHVNLHANMQ